MSAVLSFYDFSQSTKEYLSFYDQLFFIFGKGSSINIANQIQQLMNSVLLQDKKHNQLINYVFLVTLSIFIIYMFYSFIKVLKNIKQTLNKPKFV